MDYDNSVGKGNLAASEKALAEKKLSEASDRVNFAKAQVERTIDRKYKCEFALRNAEADLDRAEQDQQRAAVNIAARRGDTLSSAFNDEWSRIFTGSGHRKQTASSIKKKALEDLRAIEHEIESQKKELEAAEGELKEANRRLYSANFKYESHRVISDKVKTDRTVSKPPGARLLTLAKFLFTSQTYERIVVPIVSDARLEYCEALYNNRIWNARWIQLRMYITFIMAIGILKILAKILGISKPL